MITIEASVIEKEVTTIVKEICLALKIDATINSEFCPGDYIKSQVLLDAISTIEDTLSISIPNDCYIFSGKNRRQLSITETVQKIIKAAENGN